MTRLFKILTLLGISLTWIAATPKVPTPSTADQVSPIKVGDIVPNVTLTNADGLKFPLNKLIKNQPTVLIFYRGGWCVYCNTQLGQLKHIELALQKLGYQIVAISPDTVEKVRESLKKHPMTYMLISDSDAAAIQAFGLAFKVDDDTYAKYKKDFGLDLEKESGKSHHLLPVPAAYVLDQRGKVHFAYYNPDYKVRVDPAALLKAAEDAAPKKPPPLKNPG